MHSNLIKNEIYFKKKINKKAFCSKNLRNLFCVGLWGYFHRAGNDLQFYYYFFCKKNNLIEVTFINAFRYY